MFALSKQTLFYDDTGFGIPVADSFKAFHHLLLLQLEFCDDACIGRFLRARGNNVRRAARMLRATLNWRERIEIGMCPKVDPLIVESYYFFCPLSSSLVLSQR